MALREFQRLDIQDEEEILERKPPEYALSFFELFDFDDEEFSRFLLEAMNCLTLIVRSSWYLSRSLSLVSPYTMGNATTIPKTTYIASFVLEIEIEPSCTSSSSEEYASSSSELIVVVMDVDLQRLIANQKFSAENFEDHVNHPLSIRNMIERSPF